MASAFFAFAGFAAQLSWMVIRADAKDGYVWAQKQGSSLREPLDFFGDLAVLCFLMGWTVFHALHLSDELDYSMTRFVFTSTMLMFAMTAVVDLSDALRFGDNPNDDSPTNDNLSWYAWVMAVAFYMQFIGAAAAMNDATKKVGGGCLMISFLGALVAICAATENLNSPSIPQTFFNGDNWAALTIEGPMNVLLGMKKQGVPFDEGKLNQLISAWFLLNCGKWFPALCLACASFSNPEDEEKSIVYNAEANAFDGKDDMLSLDAPPTMSVALSPADGPPMLPSKRVPSVADMVQMI